MLRLESLPTENKQVALLLDLYLQSTQEILRLQSLLQKKQRPRNPSKKIPFYKNKENCEKSKESFKHEVITEQQKTIQSINFQPEVIQRVQLFIDEGHENDKKHLVSWDSAISSKNHDIEEIVDLAACNEMARNEAFIEEEHVLLSNNESKFDNFYDNIRNRALAAAVGWRYRLNFVELDLLLNDLQRRLQEVQSYEEYADIKRRYEESLPEAPWRSAYENPEVMDLFQAKLKDFNKKPTNQATSSTQGDTVP